MHLTDKWDKYIDIDGDSGVDRYQIGNDYIAIKFYETPFIYVYTYKTASSYHVEKMKFLAKSGENLNKYVIKFCRQRSKFIKIK